MIEAVELQVISRILTSDSKEEIDTLCRFGTEYYSVYKEHAEYILNHMEQYNDPPDVFTFQAQFPDINLVKVSESTEYLVDELNKNRQHILLIETFNKLKSLGSGDVSEAWQYLSMQCDKVNELASNDPMDIVHEARERADQIIEFSKQARIPTGFDEIDKLMYGGLSTVEELLLIVARTNSGKAQPLWSKVLTPTGWTTMGDLKIGDEVIGENNDVGRVTKIYPQGVRDYYRVHFDDGTHTECCDNHLWKVLDKSGRRYESKYYRKYEVLPLYDFKDDLDLMYSVDLSDPVKFESDFNENEELSPYFLGVILGSSNLKNGYVEFTNINDNVWCNIDRIIFKKYRNLEFEDNNHYMRVLKGSNFVIDKLQEYNLLSSKSEDMFIPEKYFTAPVEIRKALLAGIVDSRGSVPSSKDITWNVELLSENLANDFEELARSLGVHVTRKSAKSLVCRSIFNPFYDPEKEVKLDSKFIYYRSFDYKSNVKVITSVEYVGRTECQCILLDNNTHTYLTDNYTLTHNSWVCTRMMETSQKNGFPVLYYSPEMQASYLGTRFDTWRSHFQNSQLYQGKYTPQYVEYIENLSEESTSAFVLEDKDVAGGTVNTRVIENIVKKHKIKLVIIDGLSYMEDTKRSSSDYEKYKNLCLDLFRMSKKYGCAVVVAMQANRATSENKDDKGLPFPSLTNVEGSDHPGRIATQAFALRQIFDKHVLDIRLEKSRIANNQKPVFSYAWDVNTGNMHYLPGGDEDDPSNAVSTTTVTPKIITHTSLDADIAQELDLDDDDFDDDDVEF